MVKRSSGLLRLPGLRFRFHWALAFLVWSLVPHFQWTVHRHAGAHDGHRHASLSKGEAALADRLAEELSAAAVAMDPEEFGGALTEAAAGTAGAESLAAGQGPAAHGHFEQDLNVSAFAWDPASPGSAESARSRPASRYAAPAMPAPAAAPARAPPSSPSV